MDWINFLGLLAACLTTGAFVPQVFKTWKTRSTGDLSLGMFLMLLFGTACWFVYGWFKNDFPLMAANGVTLSLALVILYFKLKEIRRRAV